MSKYYVKAFDSLNAFQKFLDGCNTSPDIFEICSFVPIRRNDGLHYLLLFGVRQDIHDVVN